MALTGNVNIIIIKSNARVKVVPNRWNQTLCLVPSIEKRGDPPLGPQRALLHLPEAFKSDIISCLILYTTDFNH